MSLCLNYQKGDVTLRKIMEDCEILSHIHFGVRDDTSRRLDLVGLKNGSVKRR